MCVWLCCHFLFFFLLWALDKQVICFPIKLLQNDPKKTAQTFRHQLDKVFLTLLCTLVILTSALVDWIEIAKKNKQEMENEMVTPTYSEKFTVILISFLLDVCVQPKCCIFWFPQHRWFMPFMKSVVWNATHPNDDFSLFWATTTWKS